MGTRRWLPLLLLLAAWPVCGEEAWLEFHRYSEKLVDRDPTPRLRVYANGRAVVHRPAYFRDPGDFEMLLSTRELEELVGRLTDPLLKTADLDAIRAERERAVVDKNGTRDTVFHTSDSTVTRIVFRPEAAASVVPKSAVARTWTWRNLDSDVQRFPQLEVLGQLHRLQGHLVQLSRRPVSDQPVADREER